MSGKIDKYETHDVDLAAFLMMEGFKYIEAVIDPKSTQSKPRVLLRFFDEKGIARDLEKIFTRSQMKQYRDCHKFLLRDIHRTLRDK